MNQITRRKFFDLAAKAVAALAVAASIGEILVEEVVTAVRGGFCLNEFQEVGSCYRPPETGAVVFVSSVDQPPTTG